MREQLRLQLAATSSVPMFSLCPRHFASLRTPSTRITCSRPCFPYVFQEDAGMDRHASSSVMNSTTACTSATAETATYFIKMDTAAPVSVSRFGLYLALQFAFMTGDIFDFPNKISHRAGLGETFDAASALFPTRRVSDRRIPPFDFRRVIKNEFYSESNLECDSDCFIP